MKRTSCSGCMYDLGHNCCLLNVDGECREGGNYEAWRAKTEFETASEIGEYRDIFLPGVGFKASQTNLGYQVQWG